MRKIAFCWMGAMALTLAFGLGSPSWGRNGEGAAAVGSPNGPQEIILLQVSREYSTGLTGFSDDDVYHVMGTITRCDLQVIKGGLISGNAAIVEQGPHHVRVHRYLDLFSKLQYRLVVYGTRP